MTRAEIAEKFLAAALTDLLLPDGAELSYLEGYAKFGLLWEHLANEQPRASYEDISRMYHVLQEAAEAEAESDDQQPLNKNERYRQVGEAAEALMFLNGGFEAWHCRQDDDVVMVYDVSDVVIGQGKDLHEALRDATKEEREASHAR